VLEGSVRKSGQRARITAQLIDAITGTHLWADRFDGSLEDVFDIQDKVASSVAGVIEPALQAAETARLAHRPTNDLTAYDLYLRARAVEFSLAPEALRLLDQAIGRDPHYGPALALAAHFHAQRCIAGWSQDPEADGRDGADLARRALQVAGDDPGTIVDAAFALAFFGDDIGAMMALVDRALALNPSFARGWSYQRSSQSFCRAARTSNRACRGRVASEPARSCRHDPWDHRRRTLVQPAIRRGVAEALAGDPRSSELLGPLSLARLVLRPYGAAR
jgi:hypothetical protein